MIRPGLFAKGDPAQEEIEFIYVHRLKKNGFMACSLDGDRWTLCQSDEVITHIASGLDETETHYVTWQQRRFTEKAMVRFIASGQALAE